MYNKYIMYVTFTYNIEFQLLNLYKINNFNSSGWKGWDILISRSNPEIIQK